MSSPDKDWEDRWRKDPRVEAQRRQRALELAVDTADIASKSNIEPPPTAAKVLEIARAYLAFLEPTDALPPAP
jgi:hypothetical protein